MEPLHAWPKKKLSFLPSFKNNTPYYSSSGFTLVVLNVYSVAVPEYDDDDNEDVG